MAQRTGSLLLFGSKNTAGRGGGSASHRLSKKKAFAIGPTRSIMMLPSTNSTGLSSSRTSFLSSQMLHDENKTLSSWAAAAADSSSMADPPDHVDKLRAPPSPSPDPHHHVNGGGGEQHNHHMDLPAHEFAMGCHFLHQVALGMPITALASILHDRPSLVNFRDYDRRSPMHVAASEGHLPICEFLVANGAVVNRSDRWGGSPLDDAHRHRHAHVTKFLLAHGAVSGSPSQSNCFITAASEGDVDEVKAFLELGRAIVDVDKGDYDKRTALHLAAAGGHVEVVRLLCETAGANVNVKDRWGHRPLDDAKRSGQVECAHILERYGAKHGHVAAATALLGKEALYDLMHKHGKIRDGNRDGELSMDWHDVKALLKDVGEDPSDEVVQKLFTVADVNGTGVIDTEEFITHSELFLGGRPARIILIVGGPGSGKGLLSSRLVKECGVVHLSSGELLRDEVSQGTELGKQVEAIIKSGGLVSSALMVALMQKRMKLHPGKRVLLDGFPRSRQNAEDLVTLCGKPELALHLTCDDTVLLERIMHRGATAATTSSAGQPRPDDNWPTALHRIRTYHKYGTVTLDFLREENVPIVYLDGAATADGVWEQLKSIGRLMRPTVQLTANNNGGNSGGGQGRVL